LPFKIAAKNYKALVSKSKKQLDEETSGGQSLSIDEVRRRARLRKDADKLKAQLAEETMDPLLKQAYEELEDERRISMGLPPIYNHHVKRKGSRRLQQGRRNDDDTEAMYENI
jgi:hypothetical protein